ncbi:mechanosensitive ion channel family protein [uncultured Bacteroides sp.]|uniref:mechanosensitive ion channel family protein n=1 Tax=uncultured Bacteroides sp. TaxID=162156 RepID=UPI002AABE924|nr:mechanosensitive ion channel family protein [uncultured Bacteroides sp.]
MELQEFLNLTVWGVEIKKPIEFLLKALIIYIITQGAASLIKFLFRRAQKRKNGSFIDQTTASFLRQISIYSVYIIGSAIFLSLIPGMETVGNSILAGAGIMAMAVGFASQEALSNFISGLFIVFAKPFRIGDVIKLDDIVTGTVCEITLRHTIIRSLENRMIIIPNSKINTSTIINSTLSELEICSFIEIGVSYNADLDKAMSLMRSEIMKHPLLIDHRSNEDKEKGIPQVPIRVTNLGDSSITLKAWAWASTSGDAFVMKCDLLKSIKELFDKENIEIPYPYSNVIIKKES